MWITTYCVVTCEKDNYSSRPPNCIDKTLMVKLNFSLVICLLHYTEKDCILTTRICDVF